MIELDPSDRLELAFALTKAVKRSDIPREVIIERLREEYGFEISYSGLSHLLRRGSVSLERALQILKICGETELRIRTPKP